MKYVLPIILITLASMQIPLFGMDEEYVDETTPFLRKEKSSKSKPKEYPVTNGIAPLFGFTDQKQLNFFYAIENNEDISSYLRDNDIIGSWRVLGVARNIADKKGHTDLKRKISKILKEKYNLD